MATEAEVRKYLDPEEPDYRAAAAALGAEALPTLEALVRKADPLMASKATYLASLIPGAQAERVLEQAAQSDHATVRVAAAAGVEQRPEAPEQIRATLMNDADPGVRKLAAKSARVRAPAQGRKESRPNVSVAVQQPQVLEGEHGGGYAAEIAGGIQRAPGDGGGDLGAGPTRAIGLTQALGNEDDSGGGGDLGSGSGLEPGSGPDGGGSA